MREQLVALLTSKVGLDQQKAEQSVDTIMDFFKSNPQQLSALVEKFGGGGIAGKIGGMFGQ